MVVHSISATATPPRPSSVSLSFRMRQRNGGGGGLSGARRALSALGNNNAQINLRLAESLLTITQDKFMKKWNFDPVNEVPMAPGRFQWASVSGAKPDTTTASHQEPSSSITANRDISTCFTLPCQDIISSRVPVPHSTTTTSSHVTESSTTVVEADSGVESDDSVIEDPDTTTTTEATSAGPTRQTTITDYLNPRKRSSSHLDCPDSLQLPASKKRLLLAN